MTWSPGPKRRVVAIASRFYLDHLDHLAILGKHCDLSIAFNLERESRTVSQAVAEGFSVTRIGSIGLPRMEARLRSLVETRRPHVLYSLWDTNEELTLLARRVASDGAIVIHMYSDPATTLFGMETSSPGRQPKDLEREALQASDGQIFVTGAMRAYLEETHGLDLAATSIVVPHARSKRTIGSPQRKLSADDGRLHIALVGFAHPAPDHGRYYVNIIRRLLSHGFVAHSHFHDVAGVSNQVYRDLAAALPDYHYHPTLPNRFGTELSDTMARYDLMGVFHELEATQLNEAAVLEVTLPSKAVCGWLNGGIPVVCPAQYKGTAQFIRDLGIGFVLERWEDLATVAADRAAIARATQACVRERHRFTHEWNAPRILEFFERRIAQAAGCAAPRSSARTSA